MKVVVPSTLYCCIEYTESVLVLFVVLRSWYKVIRTRPRIPRLYPSTEVKR